MLTLEGDNLGNIFEDIGGAIASGVGAVVGAVGSVLSTIVGGACSAINNDAVQNINTGVLVVGQASPQVAAVAGAIKLAGALCSWASGKGTPAPQFPVGSIYAFDPSGGGYRIAIPVGSHLSGLSGLSDFNSPLTFLPSDMGVLKMVRADDIFNASPLPSYTNTVSKDSPYLAVPTGGALGDFGAATYVELAVVPQVPPSGNLRMVDLDTYNDLTGRAAWYDHWYVYAAGGLVALGIIWAIT